MQRRDPLEIRLHGRGGQGTVTLASLVVDAAFRGGWYALGFPTFGTERTGAPVAAFVRLAHEPVLDRGEVHHPGIVVVSDATLIGAVDVTAGVEPGAAIVLNALAVPAPLAAFNVTRVRATELALEHLGVAKTSTAMLGAFVGATGLIGLEDACAAVRDAFPGVLGERNDAVVRAAYEAVTSGRSAA